VFTFPPYWSTYVHKTCRRYGAPDPDDDLKEEVRIKIRHYGQLYLNRPDPIDFLPLAVDTSGHLYDDFIRLTFLHAHREASVLPNELPEESDQFRFLHPVCLGNLKGSVGLILTKTSGMRISIPLDLSSRSLIPLPRFFRSRCHSFSLTFFPLGSRLFLFCCKWTKFDTDRL